MCINTIFGETYSNPRGGNGTPLTMENVVFNTGEGEISKTFFTGKGAGLTDFAVIPHFSNPDFPDACGLNAEKWAAKIPAAVYAIDEQTAIKVVAGQVEVVSEGQWKFFSKQAWHSRENEPWIPPLSGLLLLSVHCVIQFSYPGSKLSGSQ